MKRHIDESPRGRRPVPALAGCLLGTALLLAGCGRELTILSYNCGNLFDGVDDGTEYPEFDPGRGAWDDSAYRRKLGRVALAVERAVPGGPDIVCLQEIENAGVLETLRREALAGRGYAYAACYPASRSTRSAPSATTVGILSRFPLGRTAASMIEDGQGRPLREILEAAAAVDGRPVHLFCAHWKSKAGGPDRESEPARLEAAGVVARRTREILGRDPRAAVVLAGDLNESADEYVRANGRYQTALIRLADIAPGVYYENSLVVCGRPEESGVRGGHIVFFEPWLASAPGPAGSYAFRNRWEAIDHILFLPGASGLVFRGFRAVCEPDLLDPRSGRPLPWDKKKPDRGFSDHLPVIMTIEY